MLYNSLKQKAITPPIIKLLVFSLLLCSVSIACAQHSLESDFQSSIALSENHAQLGETDLAKSILDSLVIRVNPITDSLGVDHSFAIITRYNSMRDFESSAELLEKIVTYAQLNQDTINMNQALYLLGKSYRKPWAHSCFQGCFCQMHDSM